MPTDIKRSPDLELYPDDDGQPMSDNTLQFRWIVTLQGNLDVIFVDDPNVFVAGDLLWYAEEGNPSERMAPDAMVVFGRPKGYRGSYQQWHEENIGPRVVFEVLSPGNRSAEMDREFEFYDRHGVEEYYLYDPEDVQLTAWLRVEGRLHPVYPLRDYTSPRLQIRFDLSGDELVIYRPNGQRFLTFLEIDQQYREAKKEAVEARLQAEKARRDAENSARREEQARQEAESSALREEQARRESETNRNRAEQLAARLRELGVDPESLTPPGQ